MTSASPTARTALVICLFFAWDSGFGGETSSNDHRIKVYSGGVMIGEWVTTGTVLNEGASDGYVFADAATGQMVRVSGEVIITLDRPARPGVTLPRNPLRVP